MHSIAFTSEDEQRRVVWEVGGKKVLCWKADLFRTEQARLTAPQEEVLLQGSEEEKKEKRGAKGRGLCLLFGP